MAEKGLNSGKNINRKPILEKYLYFLPDGILARAQRVASFSFPSPQQSENPFLFIISSDMGYSAFLAPASDL